MVGYIGDFPVTDYRAFRKLLEEKGLVYHFSDDTEMYDIYQGYIGGHQYLPPARCFVVSVPAQVARRDIGEARDLIRTALELEAVFGS